MRKSFIIAAVLALAAAGWILSGQLGEQREAEAQKPPAQLTSRESVPHVRVRTQRAESRTTEIVLRGRSEALRTVDVKAETHGRVTELLVERGDRIGDGQVIAKLEPDSRPALVKEAKALLAQRRIEFEASHRLSKKGFRAETQLAAAQAALDAAEAELRQAQIELDNTVITAPFDGIANEHQVELGDFVEMGDPIARIVDLDPILIVAHVNETDVGRLNLGGIGQVRLITGASVSGEVRFIASMADPQTRTFRVELEVPNGDGAIPDGVSAELRLPLGQVLAHRVSPAILSLTDSGDVGVKVLGPDNKVTFLEARIIDNDAKGVWLAGLPDEVTFITVGQDFVRDGQEVVPVDETSIDATTEGDPS